MKEKNVFSFKKEFISFLIITLGTTITAFALNAMIIPATLLSGGLTGIAQLINVPVPVNVGLFYFILNVPVLILGYFFLGKRFVYYSIYGVILLTVLLAFIPVNAYITDDVLLNAIFGGAISAFGSGVVLRVGGSQGGMDVVSRVVASKKDISVGKFSLLINALIVLISSFIFGFEIALYTIISMFVSMMVYEVVLHHVNKVSVLVITDKTDAISSLINERIVRGTTIWNGYGGYTKDEKSIIYCVITHSQLSYFKRMIKEVDEKAFVTVIETKSVFGKFNRVW